MIKAWYTNTHTFHALWKFCISWEDRDLTFLKSEHDLFYTCINNTYCKLCEDLQPCFQCFEWVIGPVE